MEFSLDFLSSSFFAHILLSSLQSIVWGVVPNTDVVRVQQTPAPHLWIIEKRKMGGNSGQWCGVVVSPCPAVCDFSKHHVHPQIEITDVLWFFIMSQWFLTCDASFQEIIKLSWESHLLAPGFAKFIPFHGLNSNVQTHSPQEVKRQPRGGHLCGWQRAVMLLLPVVLITDRGCQSFGICWAPAIAPAPSTYEPI